MIYTDNKDFYPTPRPLFDRLIKSIRQLNGNILEPSAGKGDIIDYIRDKLGYNKNSAQIDAIENDNRLVSALAGKGYNVVWDDFLTYETYKEYDYIVMNPPFSNGVEHVLKAIELAENQISACSVLAIVNKETIDNAYSNRRQELLRKLDEYGADIEYVSEAFGSQSQAERKTSVEVALIRVTISKSGKGRSIYDSIPLFHATDDQSDELETALSTHVKSNEIQDKLDDIERLVAEYEKACELAKQTFELNRAKYSFYSYISEINRREGESVCSELYSITPHGKEYSASDLNEELARLRRGYWSLILDTKDFRKMLTNDAIQKLNRQLEKAQSMEINYANVRLLITSLMANQREILINSIVSIFEKITKFHMNKYSGNVHYYNGWKTNDAFRINKKVIIPVQYSPFDSWDFKEDYERLSFDIKGWVSDIIKALKLLDDRVDDSFEYAGKGEFENRWLRFKMFLNGNIHIWFKDENLLEQLNYICGQHFAWIPSEEEQAEDAAAREWVAKEFGDVGEVKLLKA